MIYYKVLEGNEFEYDDEYYIRVENKNEAINWVKNVVNNFPSKYSRAKGIFNEDQDSFSGDIKTKISDKDHPFNEYSIKIIEITDNNEIDQGELYDLINGSLKVVD